MKKSQIIILSTVFQAAILTSAAQTEQNANPNFPNVKEQDTLRQEMFRDSTGYRDNTPKSFFRRLFGFFHHQTSSNDKRSGGFGRSGHAHSGA